MSTATTKVQTPFETNALVTLRPSFLLNEPGSSAANLRRSMVVNRWCSGGTFAPKKSNAPSIFRFGLFKCLDFSYGKMAWDPHLTFGCFAWLSVRNLISSEKGPKGVEKHPLLATHPGSN